MKVIYIILMLSFISCVVGYIYYRFVSPAKPAYTTLLDDWFYYTKQGGCEERVIDTINEELKENILTSIFKHSEPKSEPHIKNISRIYLIYPTKATYENKKKGIYAKSIGNIKCVEYSDKIHTRLEIYPPEDIQDLLKNTPEEKDLYVYLNVYYKKKHSICPL